MARKIRIELARSKTLLELADELDARLKIVRYAKQGKRFVCHLFGAEVSGRGVLIGVYGVGDSPVKAMRNYVSEIRGRVLVFDAMSEDRRQIYVSQRLRL